jgi:hypothetical protein
LCSSTNSNNPANFTSGANTSIITPVEYKTASDGSFDGDLADARYINDYSNGDRIIGVVYDSTKTKCAWFTFTVVTIQGGYDTGTINLHNILPW